MAQPLAVTLAASATVTLSGSGSAVDVGTSRRTLVLRAQATSFVPVDLDPVPMVVVTLETRASDTSPWRAATTLSMGATGDYALSVGGLDRYLRVSWALTNMTSATFEATGTAEQTYCDPSDITRYAVPEHAIEEIDASTRAAACLSATAEADGYIGSAHVLPLVSWGDDLRAHVASMAAARIFRRRGADPEGPDKIVFDAQSQALKWLARLADGRLTPPDMVDGAPETFDGGSVIVSRPARGW